MLRSSALALSLALGIAAPAAFAADLIVVEARGVAFKPGQKLDETRKITLTDGQKLKLIASNGRTLNLIGPYDEVPLAEGISEDTLSKATAALEALKVQKVARLTEIGTVRGDIKEVPEPWVVHVEQAGNLCTREGQPVVFWRPNTQASTEFVLAPSDRTWTARYAWQSGVDRLTTPPLVRVRDKATFVTETGGNPLSITINVIPASVTDEQVLIAWMYEKGCIGQAAALEGLRKQRGD
jgi:hypothetical protein